MTEEERERERLRYIEESITLVEQYTQGSEHTFFRLSVNP